MSNSIAAQLETLRKGNPPREDAGLFGYDYPVDQAKLVILPTPWEPTASYGKGTSKAPMDIVSASHQLDLWDRFYGAPYEKGIHYDQGFAKDILNISELAEAQRQDTAAVTRLGETLNSKLQQQAAAHLDQGQIVAVFGGDHSCPLGLIKALAERQSFGILHIDAHHDLRASYEGYRYSHASIMRNVLEQIDPQQMSRLVSIGIRDYSHEEYDFAKSQKERVHTCYWEDIARRFARGETFDSFSRDIVAALPQNVYISLDIDGLNYTYCSATGTPVPGGFSYDQVLYLVRALNEAGKTIVGFDLCETASKPSDDWDLNVAARLLYRLCGAALYGVPSPSHEPS